MKTLEPGSYVDYASLRSQDMLPVFLAILAGIDDDDFIKETFCEIPYEAQIDDEHKFWETEDCLWVMDCVVERLNEFCPDDHYFGAHMGNGSDFGVWRCEDD